MVDEELAAEALREALRLGGVWAEVFIEHRTTHTLRLDGGAVAEVRSVIDAGAGIRVATGGDRLGFASTSVLSTPTLLDAVDAASAAAGESSSMVTPRMSAEPRQRDIAPRQHADADPGDVDPAVKIALLRRVDHAARTTDPRIRQVTAIHVDVSQHVLVATVGCDAAWSRATDQRVRTRLTCRATARDAGRQQTGFAGPGAGVGMAFYDVHTPELIGVNAAGKAVRALTGVAPPTGRVPVVLGPAGGGLLLHEACGHGLEGDGLASRSSVFSGRFDTSVGSPLVTAIDDPTWTDGYGSYAIDDAGVPGRPTVLLDHGLQVGAMTDGSTAAATGLSLSANARRESYAHPPLARMTNTFIAAGTDEPAAILGDVRSGVYVASLGGGDVNITTGDFAFTASEAWLIENGRLTNPLSGLTLLGDGPTALASVAAVGNDLALTQALCGKEEQWVPVSYGSPTLLVTGLTVTGGGA